MSTTVTRPGPPAEAVDNGGWTPSPPTVWQVLTQLRDVVCDVPRFLVSPLLRPWHLTWGATAGEVDAPMPGDDLLPRPQYRSTRAIGIRAPADEVWPWLLQVGCGRGGWYSDDLLDNFGHPSADRIVPELQRLATGQWLQMFPRPSRHTSFVVDSFSTGEWLLWRTTDRTWAWRLDPAPHDRTRLVCRMHTRYDWRRPGAVITVVLMEVADFAMTRRMLRGIRHRAENRRSQPCELGRTPS